MCFKAKIIGTDRHIFAVAPHDTPVLKIALYFQHRRVMSPYMLKVIMDNVYCFDDFKETMVKADKPMCIFTNSPRFMAQADASTAITIEHGIHAYMLGEGRSFKELVTEVIRKAMELQTACYKGGLNGEMVILSGYIPKGARYMVQDVNDAENFDFTCVADSMVYTQMHKVDEFKNYVT